MNGPGRALQERLRAHRAVLLGCEAIGWLHMAGKAHPDFLRRHGATGVSYDETRWHEDLDPAWSDRLGWLRGIDSLRWPSSLADFVECYAEGRSAGDLVDCLQAGHAMASGVEKNVPRATSSYLRQDATHMWLSTAYGHPARNLLEDPPDVLRAGGWERLLERIGGFLDRAQELGAGSSADAAGWRAWREGAIGRRGWLRRAFESTLAETRLPNNDVTLWDQSYVAAALFKSAVAGLVLLEDPGDDAWKNLKSQTRWRILTVGFGADHYEARAVRIGDWAGARMEIEAFFEDVRQLIEVDLAVGSLLFRDDQVLAFSFPGQRFDDEDDGRNRSLDDHVAKCLLDGIGAQIDELARVRNFETPPLWRLSQSTRSLIPMARKTSEARRRLAVPVHRSWTIPSLSEQKGHVCPVCGVRFNGPTPGDDANRKQRPCSICRERRKGRLDAWLREGTETIWITELADDNDRVALLTFGFDLDPWLDGWRVDSLRAQSVADWRRFNPKLRGRDNPIDTSRPTEDLVAHVERFVRNPATVSSGNRQGKLDDAVLSSIHDGFAHESDLGAFYRKMVEDRADHPPPWNRVKDGPPDAARWLVHQLFRKNASPGRLHRFWRSAERFFDELTPTLRGIAAEHENRWRTRRLVLAPAEGGRDGWKDRETYATRWRDAPLELLYRKETGDFLTICNLARVLQPEESNSTLEGVSLDLTADAGDAGTLRVGRVAVPDGLGAYAPLSVLDRSPARFRVLVPLSAASACLDAVIQKWEEEFARVWDRMPLRAGVVAFPRMTPFQAVIEAVRNLEDDLAAGATEFWRVVEARSREGVTSIVLARPDGELELVTVPGRLPDGRLDVFYPYLATADAPRHARDFTTPHGTVYRHVSDLRQGDAVEVAPSWVALTFMDSTAVRFERGQVKYLSDWRRLRNTWRLLEREAPSITGLRNAWTALAATREAWRGPGVEPREASDAWSDLVRPVLAERLGVAGATLDTLVEAAASGILEQTLEWHLRVLKESTEVRV